MLPSTAGIGGFEVRLYLFYQVTILSSNARNAWADTAPASKVEI
jgi:hypothetical protein